MSEAARAKAKREFEALQKKKSKQVLSEREEIRERRAEQTARLRALRLAKDATNLEAVNEVTDEKKDGALIPIPHRTSP